MGWDNCVVYEDVINLYTNLLQLYYGKMCTVVFDGYQGISTKDHEHMKRGMSQSPEVEFHLRTKLHNQQHFLSNSKNKTKLISMLSDHMRARGHVVIQSKADADVDIVKAALTVSIAL